MKYIYLAIASIIGILVLALKMQGTKLHKLQVELLAQTMQAAQAKDDALVQNARKQFTAAMAEYVKAGGK